MYVDKKLGGVNAVQTLSRLNRVHPGKDDTMVLDFANEAEEIQKAFAPYYDRTLLSEATDPNLLYDLQLRLAAFGKRLIDCGETERLRTHLVPDRHDDLRRRRCRGTRLARFTEEIVRRCGCRRDRRRN